MQTRRFPRTLADAFGPYTGHDLHPMPEPETRSERMAGVMLAIAIGLVGAVTLVAWICS